MNRRKILRNATAIVFGLATGALFLGARVPDPTVPVRMTVTLNLLGEGKRMPEVTQPDVIAKQGKDRVNVTGWVPARGDQAGLDLVILIDDASETGLGLQLDDLREFINAQGPHTSVAVGYIRNATVDLVQNFTQDHAAAAKALLLPVGSTGAYGSPYLSLVNLMKRWPEHPNRREVIMVTDGIDRARRPLRSWGLETINPDVDTASVVAQRTGTIVYTIYYPGVGRRHHNFWEMNTGQIGIAKLSEETGGDSYFMGVHAPVSFSPYLEQIQRNLDNQFLLTLEAKPGKKPGLKPVNLTTEVAGVEFASADNVWVPVK